MLQAQKGRGPIRRHSWRPVTCVQGCYLGVGFKPPAAHPSQTPHSRRLVGVPGQLQCSASAHSISRVSKPETTEKGTSGPPVQPYERGLLSRRSVPRIVDLDRLQNAECTL